MWRNKRYGLAVLPRQSGKDVAASMEQCDARLRTPKTTGVYISLNNPMIRDILWDKTYIDPATGEYIRGLQDNVPARARGLEGHGHGGPVLQPEPAQAAGVLPVRPGQVRCRHVLPGLHDHRARAVHPGGPDPPADARSSRTEPRTSG